MSTGSLSSPPGVAVRTVLGDVRADRIGRTDYHEHLFHRSPLLPGEDLDDEVRSGAEASELRAAGIDCLVDATPIGLGRRCAALARVSGRTGLQVVAATGAHREAHYESGHWILAAREQQLAELFTSDIADGLPVGDHEGIEVGHVEPARTADGRPVRAGLLKTGIDYWSISPFERRVLAAAATAQRRTGVALMVHLEHCSAAFEVIELLGDLGVPADRVILAHVDRNPDPHLHAQLAATGAYLGYDGWSRHAEWPDSTLIACLARAIELGAVERIVLGGDVARRSRLRAYSGMPGWRYLPERIVPQLHTSLGDEAVRRLLVTNPAALLAVTESQPAQTRTSRAGVGNSDIA